jgi:adenine/guanine phosphoribosyltransferase-like PRPP-binding protein
MVESVNFATDPIDLSKAILVRRDLSGANLNRASLTAAKLVETSFGNTQVNKVSGLECRCFTLGTPIQKIGRKILITRRPLKFPERV